MQHALEADHVAALSSLCTGTRSVRRIAAHGAVWGLGHSLTLLVFAGAAVLLDLRFGENLGPGAGGRRRRDADPVGWTRAFSPVVRTRFHFHRHRHAGAVFGAGRAPGLDGAGFHQGSSQPASCRGGCHDCARHAVAGGGRRRFMKRLFSIHFASNNTLFSTNIAPF